MLEMMNEMYAGLMALSSIMGAAVIFMGIIRHNNGKE